MNTGENTDRLHNHTPSGVPGAAYRCLFEEPWYFLMLTLLDIDTSLHAHSPTFASIRGTLELLLLQGGDDLRELVRKATCISTDMHTIARWEVPMRGWATESQPQQLRQQTLLTTNMSGLMGKGVAVTRYCHSDASIGTRIGIQGPTAFLQTMLETVQPMKHKNVLGLIGCSSTPTFTLLFGPMHASARSLHSILYNSSPPVLPQQWDENLPYAEFHVVLQVALGLEYLHGCGAWHGK